MRQKDKKEKRDTYDPICLSNIESDDEWIAEKEDPCLPNDVSWMDILESFTLEEGAPSKKRNRGPRNLNKKGKSITTTNDDEIKGMIEEVEEEDEDEDEDELPHNVILDEEDDLSNIDLGDDEWKNKI